MTAMDVINWLEMKRRDTKAALYASGGRNIDLANEADRYIYALAALKGELVCPHCEAQLTGE